MFFGVYVDLLWLDMCEYCYGVELEILQAQSLPNQRS
jgi:hypothetical protein